MEKSKSRWIPATIAIVAGFSFTYPAWKTERAKNTLESDPAPSSAGGNTFSGSAGESKSQESRVSEPVRVHISGVLTQAESIALWRERPEVVHSEKVELPAIMDGNREAAKLSLPLPGGESMDVTRWFEDRHGSGQFSISGEIGDGANGLFSMARSGDSVSGVISSPEGSFQYRGEVGGAFYVAEIDRAALAECAGCLKPDPTPEDIAAASERAPAKYAAGEVPLGDSPRGADGENEIIDIMLIYTDDVSRRHGGKSGVEADILSTVGLSNQRFRTSAADTRLRITTMREVEYDENANANEDLDAITFQDGVIDQVHTWRDVDGADLVAMSVANMDIYAGLAWLGGQASDSEFAVFSVTLHSQLDWAFTHEIGHNLGCAHDRRNAGGGGFRNYSFGYRFDGAGGRTYRTQMAYAPGSRLEQFSNPDIRFDSRPTGTSSEDNARSIRESSQNVSGFRERIVVSGDGPVIENIAVAENTTVSSNIFDGEIQPGEDFEISFDVVNPFEIPLTNVRINVSALDEFVDVRVGASSIPDIAAEGTVSVSNAIRLKIAGNTPTNAETLILTGFTSDQGTWATTATLFVIPRSIELQIASFTINDSGDNGRVGNGNGIAEPGETFDLKLNVKNSGSADMGSSVGTLGFSDSCVDFRRDDGELRLQTIASGATRTSGTFRLVAADCPRGTRVTVSCNVDSTKSGSYSFEKVLVLGTLELGVADIPITVMGDAVVRAGERVQLSPRVKNTGDAIASDVMGAIIELDSGLSSESDIPLEFGTINPGAEVGPSRAKSMRVTRFAPVGAEVGFEIEYRAEGEAWVVPYSLMVEPPVTPPMPPEVGVPSGDGQLSVILPQTHNGMDYELEWSTDMVSWESFGDVELGTGNAVTMTPEVPEAAVDAKKIFVRVNRSLPDPD